MPKRNKATCPKCLGNKNVYETGIAADGGHGYRYGYYGRCGYCDGLGTVDINKKKTEAINNLDWMIDDLNVEILKLKEEIKKLRKDKAKIKRSKHLP